MLMNILLVAALGEASDTMMKEYALNFCMSKKSRENHLNNEIYIHDLSAYAGRYAQLFICSF